GWCRSCVGATQVRCAGGTNAVPARMLLTVGWVRSRVLPPAPYVTDTKSGASGASRSIDSHRILSISSLLGGKNSNDTPIRRRSARAKRLRRTGLFITLPPDDA